jgi:hypothetical protein
LVIIASFQQKTGKISIAKAYPDANRWTLMRLNFDRLVVYGRMTRSAENSEAVQ